MDQKLRKAIAECEEFIAERSDALALPPDAAAFVSAVVSASRAQRAVEIGTSYGYSGLWIGAGLLPHGGQLTTIELEQRKSEQAAGFFEAAGIADNIERKIGPAGDILPTLQGPFDFVLNDADKGNCLLYAELLLPRLNIGGVILTDNTTSHADELAGFVDEIRRRPDVHSVHVPIGSGMEMTVRIA